MKNYIIVALITTIIGLVLNTIIISLENKTLSEIQQNDYFTEIHNSTDKSIFIRFDKKGRMDIHPEPNGLLLLSNTSYKLNWK